jgi:hypothetical protein
VLDDDYARTQYPSNTPVGNLRVTSAHEFFHAVQFAYDWREDPWLMESTSTWIEDELYDSVNDNRFYLARSSMSAPARPLDSSAGLYVYGNWIWWRYLTERYPDDAGTGLPVLVRDVWDRADNSGAGGTYSMAALSEALSARGLQLSRTFAEFSGQNRVPVDQSTGLYEEGDTYPTSPLSATYALDGDSQPRVVRTTASLAHLTSTTVSFVPQSGYGDGPWTLTLDVDLPSRLHEPHALVTEFSRNGQVNRRFIELTGAGVGSLRVNFSSADVRRVELTLTNGDHTYICNQGTQWSCSGTPDAKRPFAYSASTSPVAP